MTTTTATTTTPTTTTTTNITALLWIPQQPRPQSIIWQQEVIGYNVIYRL